MKIINVKIADMGSFNFIIIETKKYRRSISISKKNPHIKTIDIKYVFETRKSYTKFRKEWFEIKTLRKYMDEGNIDELVRNSPKQQRLIKIGKYRK